MFFPTELNHCEPSHHTKLTGRSHILKQTNFLTPRVFFSIMTCRIWFWLHFGVTIHHLITYMTYMTIRLPHTPRFNRKFLFTLKFDIFGVIYSYLISKRPITSRTDLETGLSFLREALVRSNDAKELRVALSVSLTPLVSRVASAILFFHDIPEWRNFQLWHLRDLNLWTPRWKCTRNPLDRASTSERRMVYSRVEFFIGGL